MRGVVIAKWKSVETSREFHPWVSAFGDVVVDLTVVPDLLTGLVSKAATVDEPSSGYEILGFRTYKIVFFFLKFSCLQRFLTRSTTLSFRCNLFLGLVKPQALLKILFCRRERNFWLVVRGSACFFQGYFWVSLFHSTHFGHWRLLKIFGKKMRWFLGIHRCVQRALWKSFNLNFRTCSSRSKFVHL